MKLYTKQGDEGQTRLYGGRLVTKDDVRVEAYGTVDELNAVIGLALAACRERVDDTTASILRHVQSRLFEVGADLATPRDGDEPPPSSVPTIEQTQIDEAERWIDESCATLPAMRYFILPGGAELAARLHVARTVCRRAERRVITLAAHAPVNRHVIIYLNRLSDLLFALARAANHHAGVEDVPWKPNAARNDG